MYALNIDTATGRILSACMVLPNGNYDNMPMVDTLPDSDVYDYLYINGEYIYEPIPKHEYIEVENAPSTEERIEALEAAVTMLCMPDVSEV